MEAVSRRNFERRFKRAAGNTTIEYIQRAKIEASKRSQDHIKGPDGLLKNGLIFVRALTNTPSHSI